MFHTSIQDYIQVTTSHYSLKLYQRRRILARSAARSSLKGNPASIRDSAFSVQLRAACATSQSSLIGRIKGTFFRSDIFFFKLTSREHSAERPPKTLFIMLDWKQKHPELDEFPPQDQRQQDALARFETNVTNSLFQDPCTPESVAKILLEYPRDPPPSLELKEDVLAKHSGVWSLIRRIDWSQNPRKIDTIIHGIQAAAREGGIEVDEHLRFGGAVWFTSAEEQHLPRSVEQKLNAASKNGVKAQPGVYLPDRRYLANAVAMGRAYGLEWGYHLYAMSHVRFGLDLEQQGLWNWEWVVSDFEDFQVGACLHLLGCARRLQAYYAGVKSHPVFSRFIDLPALQNEGQMDTEDVTTYFDPGLLAYRRTCDRIAATLPGYDPEDEDKPLPADDDEAREALKSQVTQLFEKVLDIDRGGVEGLEDGRPLPDERTRRLAKVRRLFSSLPVKPEIEPFRQRSSTSYPERTI